MRIKKKYKLYKQFDTDIWGFNTMSPILTRVHPMVKFFQERYKERFGLERKGFFVYRVDYNVPRRRMNRMNRIFVSLKLIKLYYLTLRYHQFIQLRAKARSTSGSVVSNFLLLLEGRIASVLFRLHLHSNVFLLRDFLQHGNVIVNWRVARFLNMPVKLMDIVHISVTKERFVRFRLIKRFKSNEVLVNVPRYFIVSFRLLCGFMFKQPKFLDLGFHSELLDVQRGGDFK